MQIAWKIPKIVCGPWNVLSCDGSILCLENRYIKIFHYLCKKGDSILRGVLQAHDGPIFERVTGAVDRHTWGGHGALEGCLNGFATKCYRQKEHQYMKIWPNLHSNKKLYWIPDLALRNIDLWSCHFRLIFCCLCSKRFTRNLLSHDFIAETKTLISVASPLTLRSNSRGM